jgi:hypothetical protein
VDRPLGITDVELTGVNELVYGNIAPRRLGESGSVGKRPGASLGPTEASTFADMSAELTNQFADSARTSYSSTASRRRSAPAHRTRPRESGSTWSLAGNGSRPLLRMESQSKSPGEQILEHRLRNESRRSTREGIHGLFVIGPSTLPDSNGSSRAVYSSRSFTILLAREGVADRIAPQSAIRRTERSPHGARRPARCMVGRHVPN